MWVALSVAKDLGWPIPVAYLGMYSRIERSIKVRHVLDSLVAMSQEMMTLIHLRRKCRHTPVVSRLRSGLLL